MPATVESFRELVDRTLNHLLDIRRQGQEAPILVAGLLTTGDILSTSVNREDRLAFVTAMARNEPLYGWLVAADMFIHKIDLVDSQAKKQDVIGVHFGTREIREFVTQSYDLVDGQLQLRDRQTHDLKHPPAGMTFEDPYAFIFQPSTSESRPS